MPSEKSAKDIVVEATRLRAKRWETANKDRPMVIGQLRRKTDTGKRRRTDFCVFAWAAIVSREPARVRAIQRNRRSGGVKRR